MVSKPSTILKCLTSILVFSLFTACGSGSSDSTPAATGDIATKSHAVFLPKGITPSSGVSGEMDGNLFQAPGKTFGFADDAPRLTGFAAQITAPDEATTPLAALKAVEKRFENLANATSLETICRRTTDQTKTIAATYKLTLSAPITPTALANAMAQSVGAGGKTLSGLPTPHAQEPLATLFVIRVALLYTSTTDTLVSAALVRESDVPTCLHLLTSAACTTNLHPYGEEPESTNQDQIFSGETQSVDILFAVDNSTSMGSHQETIQSAVDALETAMASSGLDPRMAVIPTDSDVLTNAENRSTLVSSFADLRENIKVGTNGGDEESAIYFGEKALGPDGTLSKVGVPRNGASLCMVVISDEDDHYEAHSDVPFSASDNIFFDHGCRVYGLIKTSGNYEGEDYMALSNSTGGQYRSIDDTTMFKGLMDELVARAQKRPPILVLTHTALAADLAVTVDGETIPFSATTGWTFSPQANAVVFHGSAIPTEGARVEIAYRRAL